MKPQKIKNLFLRQSYQDAWEEYEKSLTRKYFIHWDYVILTASNEEQADAYQAQIDARLAAGRLPKETRYRVLPDPDGQRVGSAGKYGVPAGDFPAGRLLRHQLLHLPARAELRLL